jgi:hypothetical protein
MSYNTSPDFVILSSFAVPDAISLKLCCTQAIRDLFLVTSFISVGPSSLVHFIHGLCPLWTTDEVFPMPCTLTTFRPDLLVISRGHCCWTCMWVVLLCVADCVLLLELINFLLNCNELDSNIFGRDASICVDPALQPVPIPYLNSFHSDLFLEFFEHALHHPFTIPLVGTKCH